MVVSIRNNILNKLLLYINFRKNGEKRAGGLFQKIIRDQIAVVEFCVTCCMSIKYNMF